MDNFDSACGRSYSDGESDCTLACLGALNNGTHERLDEPSCAFVGSNP